jgi:hypothetical protein
MSALSSPKLPGDVEKTRAREWEWDMWDMDMARHAGCCSCRAVCRLFTIQERSRHFTRPFTREEPPANEELKRVPKTEDGSSTRATT